MIIDLLFLINLETFFNTHLNTKFFLFINFSSFFFTDTHWLFLELSTFKFCFNDQTFSLLNEINLCPQINASFENIYSIYNYSIPTTKLYYPEAFVSSASFMHSDLWFMHILVYQYWLWFVFIFLIIFFFFNVFIYSKVM